jgi:hypothetical protein
MSDEFDQLVPLRQPVWVDESDCWIPRDGKQGVEMEAVLSAASDEQLRAAAQWLIGAGVLRHQT